MANKKQTPTTSRYTPAPDCRRTGDDNDEEALKDLLFDYIACTAFVGSGNLGNAFRVLLSCTSPPSEAASLIVQGNEDLITRRMHVYLADEHVAIIAHAVGAGLITEKDIQEAQFDDAPTQAKPTVEDAKNTATYRTAAKAIALIQDPKVKAVAIEQAVNDCYELLLDEFMKSNRKERTKARVETAIHRLLLLALYRAGAAKLPILAELIKNGSWRQNKVPVRKTSEVSAAIDKLREENCRNAGVIPKALQDSA